MHAIAYLASGILMAASCTLPKATSQAQNKLTETTPAPIVNENLPAVTTYILKIKRAEKDSYKANINLVQKITANGSLKRTHLLQSCTRCLEVRLLKADETILEEQRLPDPLVEEIEYLDEQGDFRWITVKPDEKVIAVRTYMRSEVALLQFRFSEDPAQKWITLKL